MTPIAHALARDAMLPLADRRYRGVSRTVDVYDGWHFFECSSVYDSAEAVGKKLTCGFGSELQRSGTVGPRSSMLAFLPAPKTWIEFSTTLDGLPVRAAILLQEDRPREALVDVIMRAGERLFFREDMSLALPLTGHPALGKFAHDRIVALDDALGVAIASYGILAMINTPRVIGRRTHAPHRGLERELIRRRSIVGQYPLQGWSELLLRVTPPRVESDRDPTEVHFTGSKALHFVRCHLRIRLGLLELVSPHWRGDAALGIKRTRYRLAA